MAVGLRRGGRKTLTASLKVSVTDPNAIIRLRGRRQLNDWEQAWGFYDSIGEVHFALNEVGREMQRIEFVAQKLINGIWETQPRDSKEAMLVDAIQSFNGGQGQVLKSYYLNSKVCGECWLVIYEREGRTWFDICSPDEITAEVTEQGVPARVVRRSLPIAGVFSSPELSVPEVLPDNTTLIRFWASHPRYSEQADSPLLALRIICEELDLLTKSTKAKIMSRLMMAGILKWPNTISDVSGELPTGDPTGMSDDPNIRKMINSMQVAIDHPEDPSGAMPIIVKGPGDELAKLDILTFDRDILETDIHLRAELLERIIAGLDIHRETSQGSGDSNHWNAWASRDVHLNVQVFPDVEGLCVALTKDYYRDQLESVGIAEGDQLDDHRIWYSADELIIRPNKAEDFRQLRDRAVISDAALRASGGADESDAPDTEEQVRAIGQRIQNAWLSTFGIQGQADWDWDKINGISAAPGPAPGPQDKSTDPGSPNDNESDKPKSQRPGS